MFRNALFASVIALGAAGAAHAQAPDVTGRAPPAAGNVGGVAATIEGGGEDRVITYATGGAGAGQMILAQPPRLARARNANGSLSVEYLEPETARPGREAWLVGSGDDAEVAYRNPH
jgi:hypothetical protein